MAAWPGLCFLLADASWWLRRLWGEGTWMKETVAIESPRCAVELRRAEVDGGRESHVDGGGLYFKYHLPLGSSGAIGSNTCGSDHLGVAVSSTVVQVSTGAGAGAACRRLAGRG